MRHFSSHGERKTEFRRGSSVLHLRELTSRRVGVVLFEIFFRTRRFRRFFKYFLFFVSFAARRGGPVFTSFFPAIVKDTFCGSGFLSMYQKPSQQVFFPCISRVLIYFVVRASFHRDQAESLLDDLYRHFLRHSVRNKVDECLFLCLRGFLILRHDLSPRSIHREIEIKA